MPTVLQVLGEDVVAAVELIQKDILENPDGELDASYVYSRQHSYCFVAEHLLQDRAAAEQYTTAQASQQFPQHSIGNICVRIGS